MDKPKTKQEFKTDNRMDITICPNCGNILKNGGSCWCSHKSTVNSFSSKERDLSYINVNKANKINYKNIVMSDKSSELVKGQFLIHEIITSGRMGKYELRKLAKKFNVSENLINEITYKQDLFDIALKMINTKLLAFDSRFFYTLFKKFSKNKRTYRDSLKRYLNNSELLERNYINSKRVWYNREYRFID